MSQPDSGEHSVRSLAEILREHGLETELGTRPGRRRRTTDDPEVTGRSPRVEPTPRPQAPGRPADAPRAAAPVRTPGQAPAAARTPAVSSPARTPAGSWADRSSGARPAAGLAGPAAPAREPAARASAPRAEPAVRAPGSSPGDRLSTTGRVGTRADVAPPPVRGGRRSSDLSPPTTASPAAPAAEPATGLFGTGPSTSAIRAVGGAATGGRAEAHPVTGPIPVQRAEPAEDDEPLTGKESALAWVRFVGELVLALAVGIGLYFAFTVLWELMPYVALVAAPVAVTALVAGVAAYRQRRGQGSLGVRLLAVLTLAGTVLVIAPAAGLLAG
jgi:hypothetical protein